MWEAKTKLADDQNGMYAVILKTITSGVMKKCHFHRVYRILTQSQCILHV